LERIPERYGAGPEALGGETVHGKDEGDGVAASFWNPGMVPDDRPKKQQYSQRQQQQGYNICQPRPLQVFAVQVLAHKVVTSCQSLGFPFIILRCSS